MPSASEWATIGGTAAAVVFAALAAHESKKTRKEAANPSPVPYNLSFFRYNEEAFTRNDHGVPTNVDDYVRYRVSFVNEGTRPVRVLDLGYEIHDGAARDGRTVTRDGKRWDLVSHPDVPTTVDASDGIEFDEHVGDFPDANYKPAEIGRAFVDLPGRSRDWVPVVDGDPS